MKKFLTIALIAAAMTSCCNNKCDKSECAADTCATATETTAVAKPEVPEGVVKAIECYINGGRPASSEAAKPGFAETARRCCNGCNRLTIRRCKIHRYVHPCQRW